MTSRRKTTNRRNADSRVGVKIRIDKWLWAARFYKTRSIANDAIKSGKISQDGIRVKPSKDVQVGDILTIKQAFYSKTVEVLRISDKRGPAVVAQTLYEETPASIEQRQQLQLIKQAQPAMRNHGEGRPTKRERRKIIRFTGKP